MRMEGSFETWWFLTWCLVPSLEFQLIWMAHCKAHLRVALPTRFVAKVEKKRRRILLIKENNFFFCRSFS